MGTIKKNYFFCSSVLLFLLATLFFKNDAIAVDLPEVFKNEVFSDNIRTVQINREGWKLSNPVISLNEEAFITLTFDDLSDKVKSYYYTIVHCDRNWKQSRLLNREDYLPIFTEYPVTDFAFSQNTTVRYINYRISLPNNDIKFKYSGNYALVVYDNDDSSQPIVISRFYVVEPKVSINCRIHRATFDNVEGENQEVDFVVNHPNFNINNPVNDVKVVVKQNNRDDNAITNLKPLFISPGKLDYDYNSENVFKGENEFRYFDIRSIKYNGEGVGDLSIFSKLYHATLFPDKIRTSQPYRYYQEMNGWYTVEATSKKYVEIESDYFFVHFTLPLSGPLLDGGVYVYGALSYLECSPRNKMTWNQDRNEYELTLLLKQGYYNYCYAWMDNTDRVVKCYALEGSHFQTENDYQIFVYHGAPSDRYDKLVGYQLFNSSRDKSF